MKRLYFFCFLILGIAVSNPLTAQNKKTVKSVSTKGDTYMDQGKYYDAIQKFKKAFDKQKKAPMKSQAAYKAGECYRMMSDWKNAEDWYGKAAKANAKDPMAVLRYADALKSNGKYDEATAQYNAYKVLAPSDPAGEKGVQSSALAQGWKDKPLRISVTNFSVLNTKYYDYGLVTPKADPNTAYFTSSRVEATGQENDNWYGEKFFDTFKTTKDNNGRWSTPIGLPSVINDKFSDGSIYIDPTGTTMYFTRASKIKGKETVGRIFKTTYSNGRWSDAEPMPFNSDNYSVGQPTITDDGSTMYFVSDMPGGQGAHDLWMSKNEGGTWGQPVNMGPSINTPGDEMYPIIRSNGKLYFSSNGHPGMGGWDIFSSSNEGGSWSQPKNAMAPVNSGADDFAMVWITDTSGYLSSGREGGMGGIDIYQFVIPPLLFNVSGRVYDTDTKASLEGATVELFGSDGTALSVKTGADGMYQYSLKPNTKYKVSASLTGYLSKFLEVSTIGLEDNKDFVGDFDFPLHSTVVPINLPEIFYDLDKSTLRPESKAGLDALMKALDENPTIVIKLTAHTDYRADDAYNMKLSDRRAKSVVDYLISHKVPKERLSWEGKGESTPKKVENDTDYPPFKTGDVLSKDFIDKLPKEEQEKAHQYNRRTEFEVLRTDYIPKD